MDRFKLMTTLVTIVDCDSMAAASRKLGISESSVSRHLASLEAHLGEQLVARDAHRLYLTHKGEAYVRSCRVILHQLQAAEGQVRQGLQLSELDEQ